MKYILKELFYGNICPDIDCRNYDKKTKSLMESLADNYSNLNEILTDKQKELLKRFDECYVELTGINELEVFTYAFRLGARLVLEVLFPNIDYDEVNL